MKTLVRIYRLLNILSVDVALGAVICAVFFADTLEVHVLPQAYAALGLTVWIIYTADHLMDAALVRHLASSARHRFHQEHFRSLVIAFLIGVGVDLLLAFLIRRPVLESGLVFGCFVGLYILFNQWLTYVKELMAGLLYSGGVLLPAFSLFRRVPASADQWLIAQFVTLVFINLLLFAWLSYGQDKEDGQKSLATSLGKAGTSVVLWIFFGGFALLVSLPAGPPGLERFVLISMGLMLFLIFIYPDYFQRHDRFRLAGDAVFLFPLVALIAERG